MRKTALPLLIVLVLSALFLSFSSKVPSAAAQDDAAPDIMDRISAQETRVAELEEDLTALSTRVASLEKTASAAPTSRPRSLLPTATPRPARQATEPEYEILSIDARVTETNSVYWKYAWVLEIANYSDRDIYFNAEIQFQDADGFVIDTGYGWDLVIRANETKKFTDATLIRVPGASQVENIYAQTRVTN